MQSFDHRTYTNLLKQSSELGKQYRIDCWLEKKVVTKEESNKNATEEVKNIAAIDWKVTEEETSNTEIIEDKISEDTENVEFTKEDLITKLKDAKIKFHPNSKDETLLKKCIENNII